MARSPDAPESLAQVILHAPKRKAGSRNTRDPLTKLRNGLDALGVLSWMLGWKPQTQIEDEEAQECTVDLLQRKLDLVRDQAADAAAVLNSRPGFLV